jgi:acyl-CoA dehydrogenase
MSDGQAMLVETADRLFGDLAATRPDFAALWAQIGETGFPSLLIGEDEGGFGGDWVDLVSVLRLAGYRALPAPLAEATIAARLAADAGLPPMDGLCTIAALHDGSLAANRFTGTLRSVPWGAEAETILAVAGDRLIRLSRADAVSVVLSQNPAGDPRDRLVFENSPVEAVPAEIDLFAHGALARAAMMAGALDAALARSVAYVNERVQFGRPIGKFQAVQQSLAVFAEEAAAVNCAAQAAAQAMDGGDAAFEIAAAKLRANMAAAIGGATAHQVHGAIGFTQEYDLHRWTRRLIAWSSEFGSERYWADWLGGQVAMRGAAAFWRDLTARADTP